jgi:uncharacterized iron-regulated membrane protein
MVADGLDIWIGCSLIVLALSVSGLLVFWSRRRIDRIARSGKRSAREITRELNGDG